MAWKVEVTNPVTGEAAHGVEPENAGHMDINVVDEKDGAFVALVFGDPTQAFDTPSKAGRAAMIAAAPELLAVAECEEALGMPASEGRVVLERHGWVYEDRLDIPAALFVRNLRRAAIAKATGEAK